MKDGNIVLQPKRENADHMILLECAEQYGAESSGLGKVRELTRDLKMNMTEYVRKTRDENNE